MLTDCFCNALPWNFWLRWQLDPYISSANMGFSVLTSWLFRMDE